MRNGVLHILGWPALAAAMIALPHGLSFSQQEILVFLTINVLLVTSIQALMQPVTSAIELRRHTITVSSGTPAPEPGSENA